MKNFFRIFIILISLVSGSPLISMGMPGPDMQAMMQGQPGMQGMPDISPEDFQKMVEELEQFFNSLSPEERAELEEIGRRELRNMNIDPDTLQAIDPNQPTGFDAMMQQQGQQPPTPATPPQEEEKPIIPQQGVRTTQEIQRTLGTLIEHLNFLSAKASSDQALSHAPLLAANRLVINRLLAYAKIINKPQHHERLTTTDTTTLFNSLYDLSHTLKNHEPSIIFLEGIKNDNEEDPYDILNLTEDATAQDIEKAYQRLASKKDPALIEENMRSRGLSEKDIQRSLKDARLGMNLIKQAYEQLKDPKLRAQVDRSRSARQETGRDAQEKSTQAITKVMNGLTRTIDQQNLLNELENFLKKHEPEELAQRKRQEQAEAERKKEQLAQAQQRPMAAPTVQAAHLPAAHHNYPQPGGGYPYAQPQMPQQFNYPYDYFPEDSGNFNFPQDDAQQKTAPKPAAAEKKQPDAQSVPTKTGAPTPPQQAKPQEQPGKPAAPKPQANIYSLLRETEEQLSRLDREIDSATLQAIQEDPKAALLKEKAEALSAFNQKLTTLQEHTSAIQSAQERQGYLKNWDNNILRDRHTSNIVEKLETLLTKTAGKQQTSVLFNQAEKAAATLINITNDLAKPAISQEQHIWRSTEPAYQPIRTLKELRTRMYQSGN